MSHFTRIHSKNIEILKIPHATVTMMRRSATTKYLQSKAGPKEGQNKVEAINTYAAPVIKYPTDTITWPKEADRSH